MAAPKKIRATVISVTRYSESVIEYLFNPNGRIPSFKPGQFLHLAIDEYDPSQNWPESRVFSIANTPFSDSIKIVISVKGKFTSRMSKELLVGSNVWLKLAYGNFIFESDFENIVLIAGGTGISPYISFLENCLIRKVNKSILLHYGVKNEGNIIFSSTLEKCQALLPNFNYTIYCENGLRNDEKNIKCGLIDIQQIISNNQSDTVYYLSGPPLMVESFKNILIDHHVLVDCIHIDEW